MMPVYPAEPNPVDYSEADCPVYQCSGKLKQAKLPGCPVHSYPKVT
jgi:hypothetical protein